MLECTVELIILWNLRSWIFTYQFPNVSYMERTVFTIEDSQWTDTQNLYTNYLRKLHSPWLLGALLKPLLTDKKQIINLIPDRNFVKVLNSHRKRMKMHKTTTWFIVYTYILWQKMTEIMTVCFCAWEKDKKIRWEKIVEFWDEALPPIWES